MDWDWDENPIYESDRIRMDGSRSPLVVYSFKLPRQVSDDEIQIMLDYADLHLDRGLPYIALIELHRGTGIIGARQRRMFADWLEARKPQLGRDDFSTVVVVPEAIFRAVLRVVYRFRQPPIRTLTVASNRDAVDTVRDELARIGSPITPETESFLRAMAS
ncbi:MAG: hypothetical protein AAF436_18455 [Myxococcota bacterium]